MSLQIRERALAGSRPPAGLFACVRLAALCSMALFGGLRMAAADSAQDAAKDAAVATALSSLVSETGVPGITFAVYGKDLQRRYSAGLADRETRAPMLDDTVMMGASTGKMIVAVLAYQELQAGQLHLTDKVSHYLASNPAYDQLPGASDFTIAMLLTHSTGLVDGAVDLAAMADSRGAWTSERRFKAARNTQLLSRPGTAYSYSDLNYQILAAVLESIEGRTFEELATSKVLGSVGMTHTTPALAQHIPGLASGYAGPTTQPQYEGIHLPNKTAEAQTLFMNPAFEGGGGGFATCSPDMAKFIYTVFNGSLIDRSQLDHMTGRVPVLSLAPVPHRKRVAAGMFSYQTALGEAFGHSGIWFGFKTMVLYYPSLQLGAAMQVNSQIDASGADLTTYRIEGRRDDMVQALTELVKKAAHVRRAT
jgi:D-alanyl-D-alanine carboxypeptidase